MKQEKSDTWLMGSFDGLERLNTWHQRSATGVNSGSLGMSKVIECWVRGVNSRQC